MKKITAIILAALMVLSLAACAGGGESGGNSQDTEPQQSGMENVQMPEESQTQEQTSGSDIPVPWKVWNSTMLYSLVIPSGGAKRRGS